MRKIFLTVLGLFIISCNFLSSPQNKSETLLVGRHPNQWMSDYGAFSAFNDILPFEGGFAYPTEYILNDYTKEERQLIKDSGRITSYGLDWIIRDCAVVEKAPFFSARVMVVLYNSIVGAQNGHDFLNQLDKEQRFFQSQEAVELGTGVTGVLSLFEYATCDDTAFLTQIMFQQNNLVGIVTITTTQKNSEESIQKLLITLSTQLSEIIKNEVQVHPGNETDIISVAESAPLIELPSVTNPSANDSGNDTGSFGTDDPSTDEECIHSIYAPTYKMCDEEYQFLQSQDP